MTPKETLIKVEGRILELSNLDKILYPGNSFTKAQVLDYYARVCPVLLPHLRNRPLTMKRYPDGVTGPHFYEKNAPKHTPEWVQTFPVPHESEKRGERQIEYVLVNDLPTLIWTANLANLELHVFLAQVPKISQPTMIVFDLDPGPPAGILECAHVALWLKEILDRMRLQSFVKSSGSKGMHVYVPLNTPVDYKTTSAFSRTLAHYLQAQHPDLVVSEMSKTLRKGKVFIDWSQNSESKTTVAVYSLRATNEIPYLSIPFEWDEVRKFLKKDDPHSFYLQPEEALKRIRKKGDLFAAVVDLKQKLPSAFEEALQNSDSERSSRKSAGAKATDIRTYNRKRDFSQTPEPAGKVEQKSSNKDLLFVIQKHQARRLHYDFRLEMEGVLRSWAIPKGIPTTSKDRRLAVHVEDHPLDYARFEGTIPEGNYGAGTVMVWDIGTYRVKEEDPVVAYRKGKIHMELNGKKLKGEWTLIYTPGKGSGADERRWLLIKTGKDAPPISQKREDESVLTGRTMKQIKTEKTPQWKELS